MLANFKFSDCFNGKWSNPQDVGNGLLVKATYIKNSASDRWWIQFINSNNNSVAFTYTVYSLTSHYTTQYQLGANSSSTAIDACYNLGNLYGEDIMVGCTVP